MRRFLEAGTSNNLTEVFCLKDLEMHVNDFRQRFPLQIYG